MSDDTGQGPTSPSYKAGDLEAAARAAREEAARKARAEAEARAAEVRAKVEREAQERDARARAAADAEAERQRAARVEATSATATSATAGAAAAGVAGASAAAATSGTDTEGAEPAGATPSQPLDEYRAEAVDRDPVGDAPIAEAAPAPAAKSRNDSSVLAFFRELPVLLAVAFLLAFLLRTFVVQVFYIPSGSMIPTLEINDRIVVEKISYLFREPERGEIVVFEGDTAPRPVDESTATKITRGIGQFLGVVPANARDFVKRVIGLPGDEITIEDGVVTVNGVELDEPYAVEDLRDFGPYTVPEGKLFFLGDNRPSSADSRIESALGFVDRDHVVGRAMVIVWPFEHFDGLGTPDYGPIPER